ncbi:MAG TPA: ribose 5-phosphate isomerase B [Acholeplasmatales bacterium]|nr:ribose 5-phosphate isomerase B [Acholeplasmatales bacterium]
MKIAIGSDHAGFPYKDPIVARLKERGIDVIDVGTASTASTDYPIYAFRVADAVAAKHADLGVLICGTGIGMSIAANKVQGIRAGAVQSAFAASAVREHNDCNVLCVGSRTNTLPEVLSFVDAWLDATPATGERHTKRIRMISDYEGGNK